MSSRSILFSFCCRTMSTSSKRVFISYSHDSEQHRRRVRQLADSLRIWGVDARIDQYESTDPLEGWPIWMEKQIEEAENVLLICTETYLSRVRKNALPETGRGVCWEANLIYAELYAAHTRSNKFIPVILDSRDRSFVPKPLGTSSCFLVTDETNFEYLVRRLVGQTNSSVPPLGELPNLPVVQALPMFSPTSLTPEANFDEQNGTGLRIFEDSDRTNGHQALLAELDRALCSGDLMESELGPMVLAMLREETHLEVSIPLDTEWLKTAIRLSDMYFVPVRSSAGDSDWQRDVAQVATPIIVGMARSLKRSADAQATVVSLCHSIAKRLRLSFDWPTLPDAANELSNSLYRACLNATELESDDVLSILKSIPVQSSRR
jgi:hypothetical protein